MSTAAAVQYLKEHADRDLEQLRDLCRIPSVSTTPEHAGDVRRAVEWTRDRCLAAGLKAELHDTDGHPLVYAEWCDAGPDKPTLLVYGHVDVQPAGDRSLWNADPFEPVLDGEWLYCRGSADDKGQVFVYIRAAEAWLKTAGRLPCNLKLVIEGEEEIGSMNLEPFLRAHTDRLRCDAILISDTQLFRDGHPAITQSTRGMVYKEVFLSGPKHDLHSGAYGGAVLNPANALAALIARLHDDRGRVTVPGFYDNVRTPSEAERAAIAAAGHSDAELRAETGVPELWSGEQGFTAWERRCIRPVLDVNGLTSGFQGKGANTIIPARASAKISMRLVAGQEAAKVSAAFDAHVRALCPPGLRCEVKGHGPATNAYEAPSDHPVLTAAKVALEEAFGVPAVMPREGGSLPILPMFREVLGADSIMIGLGSPDCAAHGPNEKVSVADLDRGAEAIVRLLAKV